MRRENLHLKLAFIGTVWARLIRKVYEADPVPDVA
jgi:hypothetical protein